MASFIVKRAATKMQHKLLRGKLGRWFSFAQYAVASEKWLEKLGRMTKRRQLEAGIGIWVGKIRGKNRKVYNLNRQLAMIAAKDVKL